MILRPPVKPPAPYFKSGAELEVLHWLKGGRLHHAVIFTGQTAERRRQLTVEMAKVLFCESQKSGMPCEKCTICYRLKNGMHPDLVIFDSKPTDFIRIEQVRQFCGELDIGQTEAPFKIGVLDNADRMNVAAANAFLKTLEEPRENRLLWLLASQPNSMLATIRSRCLEMSLGTSVVSALPSSDDTEIAAAFGEWARHGRIPEALSEVEKDREKGVRWVSFIQTQLRNAAVDKENADSFFKQWSQYELIYKFEKAVELESRLRSQANYALMFEVFFRSELQGERT